MFELNHQYIGAHIRDYIENNNMFDLFELSDVKSILKYANLNLDNFSQLLMQSAPIFKLPDLCKCIVNTNVRINNIREVILLLKSIRKYMNFGIFDQAIAILKQTSNEIESLQSQTDRYRKVYLEQIEKFKNSNDFKSIYEFFEKLSTKERKDMIQQACDEGLNNKKGEYGRNILHEASCRGNLALVKNLIECNCDKEAPTKFGYTPLICASYYGHLDVVKYLISVGADKEAISDDQETPLIWASYRGHLEIVKYLISVGAKMESKNYFGWTLLIWASREGNLDIVKYLIQKHAKKEEKDYDGWTPLIHASAEGQLDIVKYLISINCKKEARDDDGWTPLIWAAYNGHLEVFQYLISQGANLHARDNDGDTALDYAKCEGHRKIVNYIYSLDTN